MEPPKIGSDPDSAPTGPIQAGPTQFELIFGTVGSIVGPFCDRFGFATANASANASAHASANAISMQMEVQMQMKMQVQTQFQCQSDPKVEPGLA